MQAKGSWILISRHKPTEKKVGGIILPASEDDVFYGKIVSLGENLKDDCKVAKGDNVVISQFNTKTRVGRNVDGDVYAIKYEDILASLDEDED